MVAARAAATASRKGDDQRRRMSYRSTSPLAQYPIVPSWSGKITKYRTTSIGAKSNSHSRMGLLRHTHVEESRLYAKRPDREPNNAAQFGRSFS
jgi:hypothetical protein